ncbi:MAG: TIGR01777 family oxidoreductase [Verrucomicrobiota bacterium]
MKSIKKVVIAGGSGFLGSHLRQHLIEQGAEVVILTRNPDATRSIPGQEIFWDGKTLEDWQEQLEGADALVNLAGHTMHCRYNTSNRKKIIDSRCDAVHALGTAMTHLRTPPTVWIQISSLGIYGDTGDVLCDESAKTGQTIGRNLQLESFPADVCDAWEGAFHKYSVPGTRKVLLRNSFVLSRKESALGVLENMTRIGFGGTILPGTQYLSWIHIHDFTRLITWIIQNPNARGTYNSVSPNPVTNREFMCLLRNQLNWRWAPPIPGWAVHLGALFMYTEPSFALAGRRCVSKRLSAEGFKFNFPELTTCINNLFSKTATQEAE